MSRVGLLWSVPTTEDAWKSRRKRLAEVTRPRPNGETPGNHSGSARHQKQGVGGPNDVRSVAKQRELVRKWSRKWQSATTAALYSGWFAGRGPGFTVRVCFLPSRSTS